MANDSFKVKKSLNIEPIAGAAPTAEGDVTYDSTAHKASIHNGTTASPVVTEAHTATLTNKTLSGNTAATLISGSGTLTLNTSGTVIVPNATDTLVGKATTDTLTNKTFDADGTGNSITNIENADIKAGAAIARSKLASGTANHALINDGSGVMSSEAQLAVSRGGTGIGSGTSGGIPYFSGSTTIASSGALTANQLVLGGGAGATPTSLAAGSQYQVLTMGAANPAYGAVNLAQTAAVTGVLDETNGGTGQSTIATGDLLYGSASNTLSKLAAGTDTYVLTLASGVPTWAAPPTATYADQSAMETATSTTSSVSPGRQQYHPSAAKAWARFNGTGSISITASYNVTSLTDNGTGDYTVNFTTSFSSANFAAVASAGEKTVSWGLVLYSTTSPFQTGSLRITTNTPADAASDTNYINVVCYGDQ